MESNGTVLDYIGRQTETTRNKAAHAWTIQCNGLHYSGDLHTHAMGWSWFRPNPLAWRPPDVPNESVLPWHQV